MKIACGLVRPTSGKAWVSGAGRVVEGAAAMGYLAELFRFPGWMSADELLQLHQASPARTAARRERTPLLELVALADARDRRVEGMSKGMQQRLGIAQALVGSPRMLLLDEPTSALDPAGRRTVRALLEELRARGIAVLLNSHLLSEVELVCDRVVILTRRPRRRRRARPRSSRAPRGVEIETDRRRAALPGAKRDDVPRLVAEQVAAGRRVYGVRVLTRSTLEEVYLEAVREDERRDRIIGPTRCARPCGARSSSSCSC